MNYQSYRALSDGLRLMSESLMQQRMQKRQEEQRKLDNAARDEMRAYQKQRDAVGDTRYNDQTTYARGRDTVADTRYAEQMAYGRGRDAVGDKRYAEQMAYGRGRDAIGDQRYGEERSYRAGRDAIGDQRATEQMDLSRMEQLARMAALPRKDDVTVREMGPEGETYSYRMPRGQFNQRGAGGGQGQPQARMTREQLLEGVRSGQFTKEQAKQMAAQMGWN